MRLGCWDGQNVRFAEADGMKAYLSALIIPKSEVGSGLSKYTLNPPACFSHGLGNSLIQSRRDVIPVRVLRL